MVSSARSGRRRSNQPSPSSGAMGSISVPVCSTNAECAGMPVFGWIALQWMTPGMTSSICDPEPPGYGSVG